MNDTATGSWKLERDSDDIAWLTIDKPGTSANVLSGGVLGELDALLAALEKDLPRGAVVISAKKSGFVAGADIKEFTGIQDAAGGYQLIRRGQQVLTRLAELLLTAPAPRRAPWRQRLLSSAPLRPLVRRSLTREVARRAPREHYPAPYAIIDLWSRYGAHGTRAFEAEARSIAHLFTTETSR